MGGVNVTNVTNFLSVTYQTKGLEIEVYALGICTPGNIMYVWVMRGFLSDFYLFFSDLCISCCSVFSKDKIHIVWMLMNQLLLLAPVNWKHRSPVKSLLSSVATNCHFAILAILPLWHFINNKFIRCQHESWFYESWFFPPHETECLFVLMECKCK